MGVIIHFRPERVKPKIPKIPFLLFLRFTNYVLQFYSALSPDFLITCHLFSSLRFLLSFLWYP